MGSRGRARKGRAVPERPQKKLGGMAAAFRWVHEVTAVALEMALPAWLGHWLDDRWNTAPWLVSFGAVLGFIVGMQHLLRLARSGSKSKSRSSGVEGAARKSNELDGNTSRR